jgi:hypothetical protein
MLKLVFLRLERQADTTLHFRECCSQHCRREILCLQEKGNPSQHPLWCNCLNMYQGLFSPNFVFIGKLLLDLKNLIRCFFRINHPVFPQNKTVYPLGLSEDQFIMFTFILIIRAIRLCLSKTKFALVTLNLRLQNLAAPVSSHCLQPT